jgi:hypothetical protein
MLVDGVEGPVFDEIGGPALGEMVEFSPKGGRHAYVGRRGADLIAVIDGREAGVISAVGTGINRGIRLRRTEQVGAPHRPFFRFSEDGSHLAYQAVGPHGGLTIIWDGKSGPEFAEINDLTNVQLHGSHLVYIAASADRKAYVVADSILSNPYDAVTGLVTTPDGAHYACIATTAGVSSVVVDGVQGPPYKQITSLQLALDGRVAYVAANDVGDPTATALMVDHKPVARRNEFFSLEYNRAAMAGPTPTAPTDDDPYDFVPDGVISRHVVFGPDGKRFAFVGKLGTTRAAFVDGKPGQEYAGIRDLQFSPDGGRVAYVAQQPLVSYVVVDAVEQEPSGQVMNLQFNSTGGHFSYLVFKNRHYSVVFDGEEKGSYLTIEPGSLRFSPDGQRFVYAGCVDLRNCEVVVDGKSFPAKVVRFAIPRPQECQCTVTFPPIIFSPDSAHVAYYAELVVNGRIARQLVLDGEPLAGEVVSFGYPHFSPDSAHVGGSAWVNQRWTLSVDGMIGPAVDGLVERNASTVHFAASDTLTAVVVKEGSIYRVDAKLGR